MCKLFCKSNNKGVATVEATLVLPIFIFSMLAVYHMAQTRLAENIIYDAAVETAEYLAETAYLNENSIYGASLIFHKYIDDEGMVEDYIKGGVNGVSFWGTTGIDDEGYFVLQVNYEVEVSLPFVPELVSDRTVTIRQRAYVGDSNHNNQGEQEGDEYVYVTDNRDVYHSSRMCTYLELSMHTVNLSLATGNGYKPCEFCGGEGGKTVIITDYGGKYHYSGRCSGLKRTIYRVKYSEVEGLGGCSRCVN